MINLINLSSYHHSSFSHNVLSYIYVFKSLLEISVYHLHLIPIYPSLIIFQNTVLIIPCKFLLHIMLFCLFYNKCSHTQCFL